MSAWHDPDRTVVDAFLVKSQFRPGSVPTYRWFLRTFEDVARRHPAVDRQMLEAWLKEMARRWRMSTLLNQVCIVDRFLRPPRRNRTDRRQSHCRASPSVQRQTQQADLARAGVVQSR
jgi:hypothetical protein